MCQMQRLPFILCLCPAFMLSAGAVAQELEEIIVTAEKQERALQDIAVSVTAISAETLDKFDIVDFEDYLTLVPGLTSPMAGPVNTRGVRSIGLRGVQTLSNTIVNGQNTVGFYINNSPIPAANPRLVDLQRIEVLRGPQGALYSANSMGGTIVLVTNPPSTESVSGHVRGSVSSTSRGSANYDVEAAVNIPLSDRAALRFSAYNEEQSGYIDFVDVDAAGTPTGATVKEANDMTATGGRAALRLDLTDSFQLDAAVMYSKRKLDTQDVYNPNNPNFSFTGHFLLPRFDEFTLAELNVDWDMGPVRIVSTTTYFDSHSDQFLDLTNSFGPLLTPNTGPIEVPYNPYGNKNEDFTQELRIHSTGEGRFQYLAGVFYTDREEVSSTTLPAPPGRDAILVVFPWLPGQPIFKNISPRLRKETAVFAEVSYDFNEQWTLVAGARAFEFDFETVDDFIGTTLLVPNNANIVNGEAKENGVVPKFRLEYRPDDDKLFFASAAEGFRMGGANFPIPTNLPACADEVEAIFGVREVPGSFRSDSLWSYELGGKMTLAGGRVTLNSALFLIDWKNQQVPTGTLCRFSGSVLNVGKVESKGFEVEMQAAPTENLTFMVSAAFIDAEIQEDFQLPGATATPFAFSGDPLPDVPKWSAAFVGEYRFPVANAWNAYLRGDLRYVGDRSSDVRATYAKDSYTEANVRVGAGRDGWDVQLFVENLTNEDPLFTLEIGSIAGLDLQNTMVPRTWGMRVERSF